MLTGSDLRVNLRSCDFVVALRMGMGMRQNCDTLSPPAAMQTIFLLPS